MFRMGDPLNRTHTRQLRSVGDFHSRRDDVAWEIGAGERHGTVADRQQEMIPVGILSSIRLSVALSYLLASSHPPPHTLRSQFLVPFSSMFFHVFSHFFFRSSSASIDNTTHITGFTKWITTVGSILFV